MEKIENMEAQIILTAKIRLSPVVKRKWEKPEKFKELCESVAAKGILFPIIVRSSNNQFEIIKGGRRFQAAQQVGLKKIPAIVLDADLASSLILRLNLHQYQEKMSVFDEALHIHELLNEMNVMELAQKIKKTPDFINSRVKLLSLCNYVQEQVFNGVLPLKTAIKIETLTHDKALQKQYADTAIKNKLTPQQLALNAGKNSRVHRKTGVQKSTGLKLVTRMKESLNLLLAVNENVGLYNLRELQMIEKVNEEIREITEQIRKKIRTRKEA